ncbi:raffinose/stachyose/melibiose transport system permease protein [Paenibacillus shirakamiensis]|uniref:Raffinose/stachyose/melibiose transport system permease protein n=1 Tax=Paenibacillus shirakamiensis TaxID=1265935 RepID=A0ABS4JKM7_9BACL|nr:sugar ABC transporter permease [Paenibacillus shirakamiensis]MBP2001625.1 raffinose/stachyose/melibiose transport system permease protein [Paenibacillus shirakamiensis]
MHQKRVLNRLTGFIFVGPAAIFFFLIVAIPFLLGLYYSFTSWNGISRHAEGIGLRNYIHIFTKDPDFIHSFWFTAKFTLLGVILTNIVGFILAYLLTRPLRTRNFMRTVFFMPHVIGGLLLGFIWQFIFVKGFSSIGGPFFGLPWLGTASTSFWAIVIVFVWQNSGYLMVIYISSLNAIPKSLIEAAQVDGASRGQVLRRVIVPMVMPGITVCLFLAISWSFKLFDLNLSLTKGGPFKATESVALNIYNEAFNISRFGMGSAKAIIFFLVVALISILQVRATKSREVEA